MLFRRVPAYLTGSCSTPWSRSATNGVSGGLVVDVRHVDCHVDQPSTSRPCRLLLLPPPSTSTSPRSSTLRFRLNLAAAPLVAMMSKESASTPSRIVGQRDRRRGRVAATEVCRSSSAGRRVLGHAERAALRRRTTGFLFASSGFGATLCRSVDQSLWLHLRFPRPHTGRCSAFPPISPVIITLLSALS